MVQAEGANYRAEANAEMQKLAHARDLAEAQIRAQALVLDEARAEIEKARAEALAQQHAREATEIEAKVAMARVMAENETSYQSLDGSYFHSVASEHTAANITMQSDFPDFHSNDDDNDDADPFGSMDVDDVVEENENAEGDY